jgi:hypothetical protein
LYHSWLAMPDEFIKITIEGEEKLIAAIKQFPREVAKDLGQAGNEAASRVVLPTYGLKAYPKATSANQPPVPYYIRGRGTQTSASHNTMTSENLGKQWYVRKNLTSYSVEIGNKASYAQWVHGEKQAVIHGIRGWRKLTDVVQEKMGMITQTYNAWVRHTLQRLGLL